VTARRISLVFGMGRLLSEAEPSARCVFERADRALGFALSRTCFEGPEETLRLTAVTQPAILATSVACLEALAARAPGGWRDGIACVAGHSLGEYSALVAAEALDLEDAVRIVRRRGEYMQEAVPAGAGAMAAVLGMPLDEVRALCRDASEGEVLAPANLNAPDQTVVAGTAGAVNRLVSLAKGRGAKDLGTLRLRDARFPVIVNVSARPESRAEALRQALLDQVTRPVRWVESVLGMKELGMDALVEVGPGRVLSGLAKRIAPGTPLFNIEDPASLLRACEAIGLPPTEAA